MSFFAQDVLEGRLPAPYTPVRASIAHGYGCDAARIEDLGALKQAARNAWTNDVPTLLEVSVSGQVPPLV
jgi:thiamine pyrophosphate-dependent acetolactate synthase large subunit-like protein